MRGKAMVLAFALACGWAAAPERASAQTVSAGVEAFKRGDYAEALRNWLPLALDGVRAAQFNMGLLYAQGLGVTKDEVEGARWYRLAADQGLPDAQLALGRLHAAGTGVPLDSLEALRLFRLAADQGNEDARKAADALAAAGVGAAVPPSGPGGGTNAGSGGTAGATPADPPAPAECPPLEVSVYFEREEMGVPARAVDTLIEFDRQVTGLSACVVAALQAVGHTDTSEAPGNRQALSEQRALAVAHFLVGEGLPLSVMSLAGRADSQLAVTTGDGVREPLNRRVTLRATFRAR